MKDTTSIKGLRIPNNRGVDRVTRAARARAARAIPVGDFPRFAIMIGQWDGGSVVSRYRRAEDATKDASETATLIERIEAMRDFCEGAEGDKRPHPTNVAKLCRDVLTHLKAHEGKGQ